MRQFGLSAAVSFWLMFGSFIAPIASAQSPETFGTATEVAHVVSAWEFQMASPQSTMSFTLTGGQYRYCTASNCFSFANVRLPGGAAISRIELDGCDDSATAEIYFGLTRLGVAPNGLDVQTLSDRTTGLAATPGCDRFDSGLGVSHVVDNHNNNYLLFVQFTIGAPDATRFAAIRVYYTLQVSPAPGAATFGDVRTSHPFFQYIEALVASGITAGCGGGNYCPDAPLTRGQMAVFLSKALGLHFAP
ncbi:MAG TPA: S-layer homology domain-containing protein [Gemmatimonadales bacterium]|nr:S-layer homology domain-containing protein [Gemmatimonadales bacterium]